jgi:hypothetical protein
MWPSLLAPTTTKAWYWHPKSVSGRLFEGKQETAERTTQGVWLVWLHPLVC